MPFAASARQTQVASLMCQALRECSRCANARTTQSPRRTSCTSRTSSTSVRPSPASGNALATRHAWA
eukprot:11057746-Lingulodinium_polyedra.AAC.1